MVPLRGFNGGRCLIGIAAKEKGRIKSCGPSSGVHTEEEREASYDKTKNALADAV